MLTKKINSFFLFVVMFGFSFFLSMTTHFFLFSKNFGHDAGIFAYIGYAITQGKTLYTEAWDNKGPLLYMINALGILINHRYGIYFLELLTLFFSTYFLYKTANLFVSRGVSVSCAIISMMSLFTTLEGGNLSEEYALPFTILAFYYISKFFKNDCYLKKHEMILVGMCISAVFLLRLNILAFLGCAVLGVIIVLLKDKNYKTLRSVFLYALLGFVLFSIPFIVYLASKGALKYCIETVYLGVLGSFSSISLGVRVTNINNMVLSLSSSGTLFVFTIFSFFFVAHATLKNNFRVQSSLDILCWISLFGFFITLFANSLSGANHKHYFISFIPVLIIPTVWLSKKVLNYINTSKFKGNISKYYKPVACFLLVVLIGFSYMFNQVLMVYGNIKSSIVDNGTSISRSEQVINYIVENSEATDCILVIGDATAVTSYYSTKRLAASNYFYYANGRFSDEAKTEFANKIFEDAKKNQPKIIMFDNIIEKNVEYNKMEDFVAHCDNSLEWQKFINENYTIQNNDFEYTIYLHK